MKEKKARTKNSLKGTGLFFHPPSGKYYFRFTHPVTGRRVQESTGFERLDLALDWAKTRRADLDNERAGRPTRSAWALDLVPLAEKWLAAAKVKSARTLQNRTMRIMRALEQLGLKTAEDLRNVAAIDDRARALATEEGDQSIRRGYQDVLKQFSKWLAANNRVLDHDPLANWTPIAFTQNLDSRRALEPNEAARALIALDWLSERYGQTTPQRLLFTTILVTGARVGSVIDRTVADLDEESSRLDVGESVGKKRRGVAALDPKTLAEIKAICSGRDWSSIVFRGPRSGTALDPQRTLDMWRQAFSLAVVDFLWPARIDRDLELALMVSRSLLLERARVNDGGNPLLTTDRRRQELEVRRSRVMTLMTLLRDDWANRMERVDVHGLRKTHHTWARVLGVPVPSIDKQLGHCSFSHGSPGLEKAILGSRTGTRHYLDLGSDMVRAGESAKTVRDRLDEAEAEVLASQDTMLIEWVRRRRGTTEGPEGSIAAG